MNCINPEVGRLLQDSISGELLKPGREEDNAAFMAHVKLCQKCRDMLLDDANENVVAPLLKKIAQERGVPLEQIEVEFVQGAMQILQKPS